MQSGSKWAETHFYPLSDPISRFSQKNPRVRKIFVCNAGAGNGCANFMGAWNFPSFLQENLHVHKNPRSLKGGGGILGFFGGGGGGGGGGECRFYF